MAHILYNPSMTDGLELASNLPLKDETSCRRALQVAVSSVYSSQAETRCLWCGRCFMPRATGGSAQRFCSTGHRQAFWIAARRWTMRAIETGLLSVDCLKAAQASVHAANEAFRCRTSA